MPEGGDPSCSYERTGIDHYQFAEKQSFSLSLNLATVHFILKFSQKQPTSL